MTRLILDICIGTAFFNAVTVVIAWRMYKRRLSKTDVAAFLDAIDLTRDHIDTHATHTGDEHKAIMAALSTIGGRVQFIMARSIADEIALQKKAEEILKVEEGAPL